MQHTISNLYDIPWILQRSSFSHSSFWWESFLNISNHWPTKWPKLICIFCLYDLVKLFDLCQQYLGWHNYPVLTSLYAKSDHFSQFTHRFHREQTCLACLASLMSLTYKFKLTYLSDLIMPKLVYLMAVQEAHKEYNSLIDQIWAKYELLDSGECGNSWHAQLV